MFLRLDFRSYFRFLHRQKLYAAINLFGLAVSMMFLLLIGDYTLRQFTADAGHSRRGRIYIIGSEEGLGSGYYLQKHLRDRYPEIETTCAVSASGLATNATVPVEVGQRKYSATVLYADTTFFRMFDFPLLAGDRAEALAARDGVVLSESFARKVFGSFDPMGQPIRFLDSDEVFTVSGVVRDIDRSVIPNQDIIMRAERLCSLNESVNPHMSNSGSAVTFLLAHEGADLQGKIPDMEAWFGEFYWPYEGGRLSRVTLTPLREAYFSPLNHSFGLRHGSRSFVMILFGVGAVILLFAVMNYVNLTAAQTGFRAREMAMRRLLGASRAGIVLKLVLESSFMCLGAFAAAFLLAAAVEPYASRLLESRLDIAGDLTWPVAGSYALFLALVSGAAGIVPALMVARYEPFDVVQGRFRLRSKSVYGRALIALQHIITIVLLATVLTMGLQVRYLTKAPMGYHTAGILDIPTEIFAGKGQIARFREELLRDPCVEAVALGCGTPHDRGNNVTMRLGPDRMIAFQTFYGDSTYFRILGLERLRDNRLASTDGRAVFLNQYALKELGIGEDAGEFTVGSAENRIRIGGIYRDFRIGTALDPPYPALLYQIDDLRLFYPWSVLVKVRGDETEAFRRIASVYERISDGGIFTGADYIERRIADDFAVQRRSLGIILIFTVVAILISALGLLAMSTYYIQRKRQEVAVRKVFGSTRREVLLRLVASFMRLVGAAFLVAVPVAWYLLRRWLEGYSIRIDLSPLIFLAAGAFAGLVSFVTVFWQSSRAAASDPLDSLKN